MMFSEDLLFLHHRYWRTLQLGSPHPQASSPGHQCERARTMEWSRVSGEYFKTVLYPAWNVVSYSQKLEGDTETEGRRQPLARLVNPGSCCVIKSEGWAIRNVTVGKPAIEPWTASLPSRGVLPLLLCPLPVHSVSTIYSLTYPAS